MICNKVKSGMSNDSTELLCTKCDCMQFTLFFGWHFPCKPVNIFKNRNKTIIGVSRTKNSKGGKGRKIVRI